jgi:hypothetical protein
MPSTKLGENFYCWEGIGEGAKPMKLLKKRSFSEQQGGASGLSVGEKAAAAEKETSNSHSSDIKGTGVGASTRVASYVDIATSSSESVGHSPAPRDAACFCLRPLGMCCLALFRLCLTLRVLGLSLRRVVIFVSHLWGVICNILIFNAGDATLLGSDLRAALETVGPSLGVSSGQEISREKMGEMLVEQLENVSSCILWLYNFICDVLKRLCLFWHWELFLGSLLLCRS